MRYGGDYDAIIIGGGPAGATVARHISLAGFRVAILERDNRVGTPVQCSGLVTERTLTTARLGTSIAYNTLTGARIHAPSGSAYEIGGNRVHAYVLDRSHFDVQVMEQATDVGVDLHTATRAVGIEHTADGVRITAEHNGRDLVYTARLVVGADGPRSLVANFLDLPAPIEVLRARGADVRLPHCDAVDQVQIFVGQRYAPGFFAWIIPLGGDRFRIGWGMSGMADHGGHLENLIADYPDVFRDIEILTQTGGLIPVGPRPLTAGDHGMVVGDAAGQAKPTSGGGLYTSLTCAAHCAETAITALTRGDTTGATLSAYDRSWRADIGQELMRSVALRRAYRELTDDELEWGLRLLRIPGMVRLVNRYGDIDYPSRLATVALRAAPALLRLLHGRPELFRTLQEPAIPYDGWSDVDALGDPIITSGWPPIGNQEPGLAGNLD